MVTAGGSAAAADPARGVAFFVYGKPATKGSMKPVPIGKGKNRRTAVVESHTTSKPWREAVKSAALDAIAAQFAPWGFPPLDGPLEVDVVFTFPKPKAAPKTRRTWPVTRGSGDVDKLLRNIFDALEDVAVLGDDAQVVRVVAEKAYAGEHPGADTPGARIIVRPLTAAVVAARTGEASC